MKPRSPLTATRHLSFSQPAATRPPPPPKLGLASLRYCLRPSVRLKGALGLLILVIGALVLLAVTAVRSAYDDPTSLILPGGLLNKKPTISSSVDSSEGVDFQAGHDAGEYDDPTAPVQRSFEEPDFALLSSKQPHEIGCDIPLEGPDAGPLLFIGIFSTITMKAAERRRIYREHMVPDFPKNLVSYKFILGIPATDNRLVDPKRGLIRAAKAEAAEHDDIVILDIIDNIDLGKTHEYFKWVAKQFSGPTQKTGRPRFVMKADDDTVFVMPNVISSFLSLDCSRNIYWGTSAGRSGYFNDYFRGLGYAVSWPLASWIGNANIAPAHIIKIEDARTGQWLRALNPVTDPLTRIDLGWTMGDWNQLDVTMETVALHWTKLDDWFIRQRERVLDKWEEEGVIYDYQNGAALGDIVSYGKKMPQVALEEHERQKANGIDVGLNVMDMDKKR